MKPRTPHIERILAAAPLLVFVLISAGPSRADTRSLRNISQPISLGSLTRAEPRGLNLDSAEKIALTEQNLPSEQLSPTPPGSASPSASPMPSTAAPMTGPNPAEGTTAPQNSNNPAVIGQPAPAPSPTEIPPPLDLSNVPLTPPISDFSLQPLVEKASTPALGASLRITDKARREIAAGKADSALRTLSHAVSIDPANAYAYFYLGRAWLMKKDYKQALIFFARAEMGFGADPAWLGEALGFEGACYEELGQSREAVMAYRRALDSTPGNLMARTGYGRLAADLQPAPEPSPATIEQAPASPINGAPPMPPPPFAPNPENSTGE